MHEMKPLVALGFLGAALTAAFLVGKRSATPPAMPTSAVCSTAVPGNIRSVLNEDIDVRDFGAVGDGIIDDTTAVQAAINAAHDAGKPLVLSEGSYRVRLLFPRGVKTTGPGILTWK